MTSDRNLHYCGAVAWFLARDELLDASAVDVIAAVEHTFPGTTFYQLMFAQALLLASLEMSPDDANAFLGQLRDAWLADLQAHVHAKLLSGEPQGRA